MKYKKGNIIEVNPRLEVVEVLGDIVFCRIVYSDGSKGTEVYGHYAEQLNQTHREDK